MSNKTNVDDFLIEMITPKVQEIESKFNNGEGLTQDDINTLLLKSQYNHINHLDMKLNEVTADVASLKGDFKLLEQKVNSKVDHLDQKFDILKQEIEVNIQKALNKNMLMMIGVISFFFTLSKIIDKF